MSAVQKIFGLRDVPMCARDLEQVRTVQKRSIFTFQGPLGAGKTTLIREFLKVAGVTGLITSPTFTYVNQYRAADGTLFYHFDLYRLETFDVFCQMGFDEYLYDSAACCVIEWPEILFAALNTPLLKKRACHVTLDYQNSLSEERLITINLP